MKLSDLVTLDQAIENQRSNPEFRAEWDRTALARKVAIRVIEYRTARNLSQRQFAEMVGLVQPAIARLERADRQPSIDTLATLTRATGLEFTFSFSHGGIELLASHGGAL